ncbi:helix-turn-helix domain-containing protein [Bradyrhizobium sp. U87765 SZCCT0131]|uniref:Crp/Fnr family transcriptional regulator n=1 Tax=unclassified Bradyrhizobium TaxID=2631580 RepID=UPI001BA7F133|nr:MULTISPECIES: helix-turn-helix domain-containing protein [unclassified Bradyrhizobium]MBR1219374.1 helix-turn-helix domain-containing protein [Bradyrhizobium sp. U87765 SZCCT0131]MBR1262025.1 helix-turn-helix domain-containing protein [Bradyrhizobium sp. U87765 SZCCT0134]MBR1306122.1 helix-turn-helix domain-containing protein [Bradyrhizobium sp. U87765 SZCCT0110]MBR1317807.1 helix-turn-helix domain-containing protein [Bradyrhizobium sp. U87765 SZCCT0109]MBR1351509.1 helix-turn-helix domain-
MTLTEPWNDARADARKRACSPICEDGGCADCKVRTISVCGALEAEEFAALEQLSHAATFAAKAMLFEQGAVAGNLFNVTEGVVRLYKSLPDGRRQIVGFALAGDFLGLALMDRYGVTAEAVTPVKACRFARSAFVHYIDDKPHLLRRLHEFAGHELSLAQDQMLLLGRRSAEEKIAAFLLNLQARYARIGSSSVTIPLPMSRQDIADYLGLTIETVSRTLTKLSRDKTILIVPDGVRLLNIERLDKLTAA